MKEKIKNLAGLLSTSFLLLSMIDQTQKIDEKLIITSDDRKLLKKYYKVWGMKKHMGYYLNFEASVISHSINRNILPLTAALELCEATEPKKYTEV
jgi:hypothetical protein